MVCCFGILINVEWCFVVKVGFDLFRFKFCGLKCVDENEEFDFLFDFGSFVYVGCY